MSMSADESSGKQPVMEKNSDVYPNEDDDTFAIIPTQFINSLGFINYDQYGNFPWTYYDTTHVFLSREYKSITQFLGIDCEMVGVGHLKTSALGRVSIVNEHGYCVYDTFCNPTVDVTDYRTQFSGIRAEDLKHAPSIEIVLKEVTHLVLGKTLVGHSIHNDLEVLQLSHHPAIRDTALYFKKLAKENETPSLKTLTKTYLNVDIQFGEHSSIQDAQATMKLYLLCRKNWEHEFSEWRAKANIDSELEALTEISDMHVEPREPDLFVVSKTVFVRANKVVGAYLSCEEYLDVQFRLLLEDFLRPLREAVRTVNWRRKNKLKTKKSETLRSVRIAGQSSFEVKGNQTILVPIEKNNLKDWEESGMFLTGSLLLLSQDNFKSVKFAIVTWIRSNEEKDHEVFTDSQFYLPIRVRFSKDGPSWIVNENERFSMMESKAFYAAYKYTLEYLQVVNLNIFPLKKYIVDAETKPCAPTYLEISNQTIDFSVLMKDGSSKKAKPFEMNNWPTVSQLELDTSQYEALKTALTQELTIIQGPPGTGKTYTSLQLLKMLLTNEWLCQGSPVLIVSYTNHSLDQVLELILEFVTTVICKGNEKQSHKKILRIGGGSKSEKIEPLTLRYKQDKVSAKNKLKRNIKMYEKPLNQMEGLNFNNWLIDLGILNFKRLPQFVLKQLQKNGQCKTMLETWMIVDNNIIQNPYDWFGLDKRHIVKPKKFCHEGLFLLPCKNLEKLLSENLPQIMKMVISNSYMSGSGNIYVLRWAFYFFIITQIKNVVAEMKERLEELKEQFYDLEHFDIKSEVLKSAKIVGMTTTGAVKFKKMVQKSFKPKIMIVEEAAHVLEAHVVASLTQHCQQMILIGDHKQLRPLTADNDLGENYQLNISLMERLVQNGVAQNNKNWTQLKKQHRMRPEIARMVCPVIYKELENHPVVFTYPHVRGCDKNLFFVDHQYPDQKEIGSRSHYNQHEANFIVDTLLYFITNRRYYKPTEITIIVAYLAQKNLLDNMLEYYPEFKDVRVSTIDGYQGEENDIILLSLVRSNEENRVGFLQTDNRVCVALSRARHGLFMIGNMTCLKHSSDTWKQINEILEEMNSIGSHLPLNAQHNSTIPSKPNMALNPSKTNQPPHQIFSGKQPQINPNESLPTLKSIPSPSKDVLVTFDCGHQRNFTSNQLSTANNLGRLPNCVVYVKKPLACGHEKSLQCYQFKTYVCGKKKITKLPCGHEQHTPCSHPSTFIPCTVSVEKKLPCGHVYKSLCHQSHQLNNSNCDKCNTSFSKLPAKLSCGHLAPMLVSTWQPTSNVNTNTKFECAIAVSKNLPCGHDVILKCYEFETYKCTRTAKIILNCGHEQLVPCSTNPSEIKCTAVLMKELSCGHQQKSHCHQIPSTIQCDTCSTYSIPTSSLIKLSCGHSSVLVTNGLGPGAKLECVTVVTKNLSCGHNVTLKCFEFDTYKCQKSKKSILKCGHEQTIACNKNPEKFKCIAFVMNDLDCGHQQKSHCHQEISTVKCDKCAAKKSSTMLQNGSSATETISNELPVTKLPCGHPVILSPNPVCNPSGASLKKVKCVVVVTKNLGCGHSVKLPCHKKIENYKCVKNRERLLACGHQQNAACNKKISKVKCIQNLLKDLPCGHQQMLHCHQSPSKVKCNVCASVLYCDRQMSQSMNYLSISSKN